MSLTRATLIAAVVVVASLAAACGGEAPTTPEPSVCDDIQADIGGCRVDRPVYLALDCDGLAGEWGASIERLVTPIFAEEPLRDGKQKSARIHDAMVLATIAAGLHMDRHGLLGTCESAAFMEIAGPAFGEPFRAGIGDALYDAAPVATWDQFLFELQRVVRVIDVDAPTAS